MALLFGRKIMLIIGDRLYEYPTYEIRFTGEFDDEPDPNIIKVNLYNLSKTTIDSISKGDFVSLSAGYGNDVGSVVIGNIKNVVTPKDGTDVVTQIEINNIGPSWLNRLITFTLNGPVDLKTVINHAAQIAGFEIGQFELVNNPTYQNGKTVYGKISSQLKKLVVTEGKSSLIIRDGKVNINTNASGFQTAYVLNAQTGLIGSPRKLDSDDDKGDYEFKMLFNHNIRTRSIIDIESDSVNGRFTVVSGKYNSDFTISVKVITYRR